MKKISLKPGTRFGFLCVIEEYPQRNNDQVQWVCKCNCGKIVVKRSHQLRHGLVLSCGCLQQSTAQKLFLKHGHSRSDKYGGKSLEYRSWLRMFGRVRSKRRSYEKVKICKRWKNFSCFLYDLGKRPTVSHTLDRINPYGHYTPSNCRWATRKEQSRNRRNTITLSLARKIKAVIATGVQHAKIAKNFGVSLWCIRDISRNKTWQEG